MLEGSLFLSFGLGELVHEQEDPSHHSIELITPPNTPALRSLSSSLTLLPPFPSSLPANTLSSSPSPSSPHSSSSPRSPFSSDPSLPASFVDVFSSIERDLLSLQKQGDEERGERGDAIV